MYLAAHHFLHTRGAETRGTPPHARPMLGLPAFWATVIKVELTDVVFAIDSILVAVAMSSKLWVILSGGVLGIVMMRLVIGKLLAIVSRYPALVDGAFAIIGWVAIKLFLEYLHASEVIAFAVPKWMSIGLIVVIFGASYLYARRYDRLGTGAETFGRGKDTR
jgi:predicted tellurium resistance membrane protein TerC